MKINVKPAKIGIKLNAQKVYPELEDLEITPSGVEQEFNHPNSYGYDSVKVKAVESDSLEVVPTAEEQNFTGLYGKVKVVGDNNLLPENIMKDKEIFGVKGSGEELYFSTDGRTYTKKVVIPSGVTMIGSYAYYNCTELLEVVIPDSVIIINHYAFTGTKLINVTIPDGVSDIGMQAFSGCLSLQNISLPNTLKSVSANAFANCKSLVDIVLKDNFDCGLNLSWSIALSTEVMLAMFYALKDNTGETAKTLTLGTTNLNKLTDEQKAIATNKNWNLA